MARQQVNVHKGKKSTITVTGANITTKTDVRNLPFQDQDDATIKLDARTLSATAGSITIELTGRGWHSAPGLTVGTPDSMLVVTLSDPTTGDPTTGDLPAMPTDVTYVDDSMAKKHRRPKRGESKTAHKKPATKAKKPALKKR